jgi:regulator of protease activity HflC (stomatin/prohibitin superfamily)
MFDKLIDFCISIIDHINPVFIIREYQEAVFLRNGKFNKVLKKGIHFKLPFVDEYIQQHTMLTTLTLPAQSLVTLDEQNIVIKSVVKYRIVDVKTFCLELFDNVDAISDISQGIIKGVIMSSEWVKCIDNDIDNLITKKVRSEVKKYGVEIIQVTLTDIAKIRTIRLINEGQSVV